MSRELPTDMSDEQTSKHTKETHAASAGVSRRKALSTIGAAGLGVSGLASFTRTASANTDWWETSPERTWESRAKNDMLDGKYIVGTKLQYHGSEFNDQPNQPADEYQHKFSLGVTMQHSEETYPGHDNHQSGIRSIDGTTDDDLSIKTIGESEGAYKGNTWTPPEPLEKGVKAAAGLVESVGYAIAAADMVTAFANGIDEYVTNYGFAKGWKWNSNAVKENGEYVHNWGHSFAFIVESSEYDESKFEVESIIDGSGGRIVSTGFTVKTDGGNTPNVTVWDPV